MRIPPSQTRNGIALIIVMLVIVVLGLLAAGFAFSMKVETRLAQNVEAENDLLWAARSGIEKACYILAQHGASGGPRAHALNQLWASGTGETNEALAGLSLSEDLGSARVTLEIVDLERRININFAGREVLEKAMELVGCDTFETATAVDSIEDWRDTDQALRGSGAEEDYYLNLPRPYAPKEGALDDLSELLLIKGVSAGMYWGSARGSDVRRSELGSARWLGTRLTARGGPTELPSAGVGLVDLFTATGPRAVNINTASREVLQLLPGLDPSLADSIVSFRAGLDRVDGNADDTPFESVGELASVGGLPPQFIDSLRNVCTVNSLMFRVRVHVSQGTYHRCYSSYVRAGRQSASVFGGFWE